jgi:O-methyltransferase
MITRRQYPDLDVLAHSASTAGHRFRPVTRHLGERQTEHLLTCTVGAMAFRTHAAAFLGRFGFRDERAEMESYDSETQATLRAVKPYTVTSNERVATTCDAIRFIERYQVPGAVVECGVWAGGNMMAAATTLMSLGRADRDLYLFDTFEGMTAPTDADVDISGREAAELLHEQDRRTGDVWCYASMDEVRTNLASTGYPEQRLHFVKGPVETTLPERSPAQIAVLRLDTDWYESTAHELRHLIPQVAPNGVLIIDDYGHWQGARRAVDEWLEAEQRPIFLARTDYTGRVAILP